MRDDPVLSECRVMLARGSRVFARAATLLPDRERAGVTLLYAWARYVDDLIDDQDHGHARVGPAPSASPVERLSRLREATGQAIAGRVDLPAPLQAIGRVVRDHGVPEAEPFVFLDGMAMDVEARRYRALPELEVYCFHVAGVLAQMACRVVGRVDAESLEAVAEYGTAFQLTNIARDVMADASMGRVYLPLALLEDAGVPPDAVSDPQRRAAVAGIVATLLDRADLLYRGRQSRFASLPFRAAWAVLAGRAMYADLATRVRRLGPHAWDARVSVPAAARLAAVGRGLLHALTR
ncbi:MAG: phytoene/squalene synthase family protein [Gemmatimonadales bacterium]